MAGSRERLTLDGVDGTRLHLRGPDGEAYVVEVDDALAEAVRRTRGPDTGAEEVSMDTERGDGRDPGGDPGLRPRDIQARVRAGASAEEIARAAGVPVEKVAVYARPVLAERAHMAQRAQRSSVRRGGEGQTAGHRTLGDAVAQRLRALDADPDTVTWDARRREDGRWVLSAAYAVEEHAAGGDERRSGLAQFTYDPPGNFVTVDDDDARWLLGDAAPDRGDLEVPAEIAPPGLEDPSEHPSEDPSGTVGDRDVAADGGEAGRRLVAVADEELPLGGATDAGDPDDADQTQTSEQDAVTDDGPPQDVPPEDDPPPRRRGRKRGGRASVPSWDEIMFGGGKRE